MKKIILLILVVLILGGLVYFLNPQKEKIPTTIIEKSELVTLCYSSDEAWLKINTLGEKITGEFHNLPLEKDSKIGTFKGEVGPLDPFIMGRKANVWWEAHGEGTIITEELLLEFGEGSATLAFGEMIDRGDGFYIYKDKENLYYIDQLSQIDCASLEETLVVKKYIKENIKTIATDEEVLGGSWYVNSVNVNTWNNNGEVIYEDGHIKSNANFNYDYNEYTQEIEITEFKTNK